MIGAADIANCMSENGDFDDLAGITPRAVSELFRLLNERTAQVDFVVRHFRPFVYVKNIFASMSFELNFLSLYSFTNHSPLHFPHTRTFSQVEVQMFQLYRDGLDDLLKEPIRRKKGEEDDNKKPPPLKITLAEHSPTGLVFVSVTL